MKYFKFCVLLSIFLGSHPDQIIPFYILIVNCLITTLQYVAYQWVISTYLIFRTENVLKEKFWTPGKSPSLRWTQDGSFSSDFGVARDWKDDATTKDRISQVRFFRKKLYFSLPQVTKISKVRKFIYIIQYYRERREQQLAVWRERERILPPPAPRRPRLQFSPEVALLEATIRNDPQEGISIF